MNLKHFPAAVLKQFGLEAQHPDEFIVHLLHLAPQTVHAAAEIHRGSLKNQPKSAAGYMDALARQGLTHTAAVLRTM